MEGLRDVQVASITRSLGNVSVRLEDLDYEDMRNGMTFCAFLCGRDESNVTCLPPTVARLSKGRTINSSTSDTGGPFIPANDDRKGAGKVSTKEQNSPANTASAAMSTAALIAIIASASTCLLLLFIGVLFLEVAVALRTRRGTLPWKVPMRSR